MPGLARTNTAGEVAGGGGVGGGEGDREVASRQAREKRRFSGCTPTTVGREANTHLQQLDRLAESAAGPSQCFLPGQPTELGQRCLDRHVVNLRALGRSSQPGNQREREVGTPCSWWSCRVKLYSGH